MKNRISESIKDFLKYLLFDKIKPLGLLSEAKNEWALTEEAAQNCKIDLPAFNSRQQHLLFYGFVVIEHSE